MGSEQIIWNIIGNIANAIAAICAVAAIVVTVRNFKSDRQEQKKEKLCIKLGELYKTAIIDTFLKIEDEKIRYINENLNRFSRQRFDENEIKELSDYMMVGLHDCLREAEIIKIFNQELYREVKQITEHIFDTYSEIINNAVSRRYVFRDNERQTRPDWLKLRSSIYKCYIEENFDKCTK
ncbi:MAG: hypothetical protein K2K90_12355 [Lachnospiraceae bacterium]|nr:hypothetical protein [Lachnospiraceae bacterium]